MELTITVLKPGWVNPHIRVKRVTFFWVTWVTWVAESNHRKPDNVVSIFKNGNRRFRAFVNIRLSQ